MTAVYLFAAAAGIPLVVWFLLSGSEDAADDGGAVGGVMLRLLPLSSLAIMAASFGVTGLALGFAGTDGEPTLVASVVVGAIAAVLNSFAFSYLRRSESTAGVSDAQLAGAIGRVVLPVGQDHRGRIAISAGGQQVYLSARPVPGATEGELEAGARILVVEVRDGIASVTRLDPELH